MPTAIKERVAGDHRDGADGTLRFENCGRTCICNELKVGNPPKPVDLGPKFDRRSLLGARTKHAPNLAPDILRSAQTAAN